MSVLYVLFLIFFALVFFVVAFFGSIIAFVVRTLFGIDLRRTKRAASTQGQGAWGNTNSSTRSSESAYRDMRSGNAHHEGTSKARQGGKIFGSDEGEYVDFEDVRE